MPKSSERPKSPVDAVQQVYSALEPFDDQARQRIVESAASLLGMRLGGMIFEAQRKMPPASTHVAGGQLGEPASTRPMSPVELIQQKQPTTNAQKIALFAYYREKVEGLARFSRGDLEGYFAKAKQPPPGNYGRDFQQAVSLGWIYEDGDDSYLTTKGLEAVEAGFGGKGQPRGSAAKKRAARKRVNSNHKAGRRARKRP
jgi:hypothetical protein